MMFRDSFDLMFTGTSSVLKYPSRLSSASCSVLNLGFSFESRHGGEQRWSWIHTQDSLTFFTLAKPMRNMNKINKSGIHTQTFRLFGLSEDWCKNSPQPIPTIEISQGLPLSSKRRLFAPAKGKVCQHLVLLVLLFSSVVCIVFWFSEFQCSQVDTYPS